jgi:hypothetical protein
MNKRATIWAALLLVIAASTWVFSQQPVTLATKLDATNDSVGAEPKASTDSTKGTSTCFRITTASTNAINCKSSAGNVYSVIGINTTATLGYVRMYNLASAPTCSSSSGFIASFPVPASASGSGFAIPIAVGQSYGTGIGFCITGGGSDTDNTNAVAGIYVAVLYK